MQHVYIFSGLGADERAFQNLDFTGYPVTHMKWIEPAPGMAAHTYASRLLHQITAPNPILIGLSFGGLIAIEVAKQIRTEKVIIISSIKKRKEIPYYFKMAGSLHLHRLMPIYLMKRSNGLTNWLFGVTATAHKKLLQAILADTNPVFLRWAIDILINWNYTTTLPNLVHIHGTADRILPYTFVNCDHTIQGGGHFMVLDKAEEVMTMLHPLLKA